MNMIYVYKTFTLASEESFSAVEQPGEHISVLQPVPPGSVVKIRTCHLASLPGALTISLVLHRWLSEIFLILEQLYSEIKLIRRSDRDLLSCNLITDATVNVKLFIICNIS